LQVHKGSLVPPEKKGDVVHPEHLDLKEILQQISKVPRVTQALSVEMDLLVEMGCQAEMEIGECRDLLVSFYSSIYLFILKGA